jgi:hypothetical protein
MSTIEFARFWSKIAVGDPQQCWPYAGGKDEDGYGIAHIAGRSTRAHRQALAYALGRPVDGMALHRCHNRPCCNPAHLYEGDAAQNSADMFAAGREVTVFVPGDRHPNTKLTDSQVREIKNALAMGEKGCDIAKRYGVTTGNISLIKNGKSRATVK